MSMPEPMDPAHMPAELKVYAARLRAVMQAEEPEHVQSILVLIDMNASTVVMGGSAPTSVRIAALEQYLADLKSRTGGG